MDGRPASEQINEGRQANAHDMAGTHAIFAHTQQSTEV